MSRFYMPFGAQRIMDARKAGKRPADLIIVSQIGKVDCVTNPVVLLQEGLAHDWRWVAGLELCFWTEPKFYEAKQIIDACHAKPRRVLLWNWIAEEGFDVWAEPVAETIHLPAARWRWQVMRMPWTRGQSLAFARAAEPGDIVWN